MSSVITFGGDDFPQHPLLMADPAFIVARREHLAGILLTHGHEDHIGALPYLWQRLRCPIYATPFTAALARAGINDAPVIDIAYAESIAVGPFSIDFISMTHSIPEPNALLIQTSVGPILHTGDWKLDNRPVVGRRYDHRRLHALRREPRDEFPFRPLNIVAHHWLYFVIHALAWEQRYSETPRDPAASSDEWKAPIVTMMFRSMPKLVRNAWVNHQTLKLRTRSQFARILRLIAMFTPLALLILVLIDIGSSMQAKMPIPQHVLVAGACLGCGDLLGWMWIVLHPRRRYGLRTPFDFVVATILGPAFVLRELPREVSSKRRDDCFVIFWGVAMVALTIVALVFIDDLKYSILALVLGGDALIQANNRLGAVSWSSTQCDALTTYLSNGSLPDMN